jgi:malate synthase
MTTRINHHGLKIDRELEGFLADAALPAAGIVGDEAQASFWSGFAQIIAEFTPRNTELLVRRDELQRQVDDWYRNHPGEQDPNKYADFLLNIGYLEPEPADFSITTQGVDEEITSMSGPQLVVPLLNARFAINAANARWGSLYDALYGTSAIPEDTGAERNTSGYNRVRGDRVIAWGRAFLDRTLPLERGSHRDVRAYRTDGTTLTVEFPDGNAGLADPALFVGFTGEVGDPESLYFRHNGLHIQLLIDPGSPVGSTDSAGVQDIVLEAAVTNIMDLEDAVAAVDAHDKTVAYEHWLGLNQGTLDVSFERNGKTVRRRLNDDRYITGIDGEQHRLHGRSLNLVRNVGHLMTNPAILDAAGSEVYEGIMDAVITALGAVPGLDQDNPRRNSRTGSIYIVKPKQHGSAEVAFTADLFAAVERLLGLPECTLKIGLMDEERRTSLNLDACIREAADRLVFINTGFMDRTGDEIHTSMYAGPVLPKAEEKSAPWMMAYEDNNVDAGLARGLHGTAQIGKGMWAMTEQMAELLDSKVAQPAAGASTAWVPSPTAGVLHATHYHDVDVATVQQKLREGGRRDTRSDLLTIPVTDSNIDGVLRELDNCCQSILGYVVRWVEQGVGCSKVPDIDDVDLMEDRATLRISSQTLANWLLHGLITRDQVVDSLTRMAEVVDRQNAFDPAYQPMTPDVGNSIGWSAARDLVLEGLTQPSGYTEPILHRRRLEYKEHNERC